MLQTFNVGSRSLFVDFTAWVAIVLAALVSVVAGLQHAEVTSMLPQWQRSPLLGGASFGAGVMPGLLQYLPRALAVAAVLSLLLVAASVGLLLRLDWARRVFIGLLGLAMAAHLLGLWLQHTVVRALVHSTLGQGGLPEEAAGRFDGLAMATQVMGLLLTLAACALLAWVMRRLMSEPVRQEFA
jgi:hypothetical protein